MKMNLNEVNSIISKMLAQNAFGTFLEKFRAGQV